MSIATNHVRSVTDAPLPPSKGVKLISTTAASNNGTAPIIKPRPATVAAGGKKFTKPTPIVSVPITDSRPNGTAVDTVVSQPKVTNGKNITNSRPSGLTAAARAKPVRPISNSLTSSNGPATLEINEHSRNKTNEEKKPATKPAGPNSIRDGTKLIRHRLTATPLIANSITSDDGSAASASVADTSKPTGKKPSRTPTPAKSRPKPTATTEDNPDSSVSELSDDVLKRPISRRAPLASRRSLPARPSAVNNNGSVRRFGTSPLDLLMLNHSARLTTDLIKHAITGKKTSSCNQSGNTVTVSGTVVNLHL